MIRAEIGGKTYSVDYVKAIALRGIDELLQILKVDAKYITANSFRRDLDRMVQWFCLLFDNQFSVEDVYESYPSDYLLRDIFLALMAIKSNNSFALVFFPVKPIDSIMDAPA